jgi:hypothetical protein
MMTAPTTSPPRAPAALRMTPGRWVALAIGVPIALAFISWSAFSLVANLGRASFHVNTAIPVQGGHLAASTGGGDITVHQDQARSSTARLVGTVQYSLIRPSLTKDRDGIHVDCRLPTGNCGLNATLDVPLDTAVSLASEGGNMQVNGIDSDVTLNSGGGNVTASNLGNTLKFSTDGGDVNGTGLSAPQVTTESGGGNVTFVFTRAPVNLNIHSDGGDITIMLPHGSTAYAITHTTDGGDYSALVPTTDSASGHTITVSSGGGNVRIAEAS